MIRCCSYRSTPNRFRMDLISIFSLFGIYGALCITPLWALLGVATIYFFARKLVSPVFGLIGSCLFAINPIQVYFSRYPTTEPITLLFIFTGLLACLQLYDSKNSPVGWGILGGASFGAALLTRIDLPLLVILVIVALIIIRYQQAWSNAWTAFSSVFFIFIGHFIVHATLFSKAYLLISYSAGINLLVKPLEQYLVFLLTGASVLLLLLKYWKINPIFIRYFNYGSNFRWVLIIAAAGFSLYAYFFRPLLEPITYGISWPSGNKFPITNGENWVRIGWYLTPLGLILATAGFMLIAFRESLGRWGLFLTLGALTTFQYVYNIMIPPYHIYAMRRYLPIVIPTLILCSAYAILFFIDNKRKSWIRVTGVFLLCLLSGGVLYQSKRVLRHRDFPGMVQQMNALHQSLPPEATVLICEAPEALIADKLGPPLHFIYGHNVATVYNKGPELETFLKALVQKSRQENKPLHLLAVEPVTPAVRNALMLIPAGITTLASTSLQNTFNKYPTEIERTVLTVERYEVTGTSPGALKFIDDQQVDIGGYDNLFLLNGFFPKELIPNFPSFRWTGGKASLNIPVGENGKIHLALRAARLVPPGFHQTPVSLALDGRTIGSFIPSEHWQIFHLNGTASPEKGISLLEITTQTFNPAQQHISPDTRNLGVALDWIRVEPIF